MKTIIKFLLLALIVYFFASILGGIQIANFQSALIAVILLSIINTFIKPVLQFIAFPITILTLGLFYFIINALMVYLMDYFVGGFYVNNLLWALLFSFIVSCASSFLDKAVGKRVDEY